MYVTLHIRFEPDCATRCLRLHDLSPLPRFSPARMLSCGFAYWWAHMPYQLLQTNSLLSFVQIHSFWLGEPSPWFVRIGIFTLSHVGPVSSPWSSLSDVLASGWSVFTWSARAGVCPTSWFMRSQIKFQAKPDENRSFWPPPVVFWTVRWVLSLLTTQLASHFSRLVCQ